jgi:hypothetical protein
MLDESSSMITIDIEQHFIFIARCEPNMPSSRKSRIPIAFRTLIQRIIPRDSIIMIRGLPTHRTLEDALLRDDRSVLTASEGASTPFEAHAHVSQAAQHTPTFPPKQTPLRIAAPISAIYNRRNGRRGTLYVLEDMRNASQRSATNQRVTQDALHA